MEVTLKMAPINPNANGIYYEKESYNNAINSIIDNMKIAPVPVYSTLHEGYPDKNNSIGVLKSIDIEKREAVIDIFDYLKLNSEVEILHSDYLLGLYLMGKESQTDKHLFIINFIDSCVIFKDYRK